MDCNAHYKFEMPKYGTLAEWANANRIASRPKDYKTLNQRLAEILEHDERHED